MLIKFFISFFLGDMVCYKLVGGLDSNMFELVGKIKDVLIEFGK